MIRKCLETGDVTYRAHAVERMFERKIPIAQVERVLRAGVVTGPELENGEWRHRVSAMEIGIVVAVYDNVVVVTIMRTGRR